MNYLTLIQDTSQCYNCSQSFVSYSFNLSSSEMANGSIFHKRLGILYNVGEYELFYFNVGTKIDKNDVEDRDDPSSSHRQISRMIYQRQYKVCAMDGGLPLMVRFSDKVKR